ncbi:glycosyltransferase [Candidatus Pelagibacter sp. HIMB1709]|uniref:glycosyltransferase n=1 Tax=Candidatus Pelagibacter sp. HIMB1709 TaxID=3413367 RepID=UPI003F84760D
MEDKIIYIHPFEFPSKKANTVQVAQMCSAFSKIGKSIKLIGLKKIFTSEKDIRIYYQIEKKVNLNFFLPIKIFNRNLSKYLILILVILQYFIFKKKYIIYSRDIKISYILSKLGFKNILEMHTTPYCNKDIVKLQKIYDYKNFLKIVFISKSLENFYQKFISTKKFLTFPDGVSLDKKIKKKKLFKLKKPKISYIGSFHKGKGVEFIIKIAKHFKNFDFDIYGGDQSDIDLIKNKSNKNVIFHGHVPHNKVKNILFKTDIALMPYQKKVSSVGQDDISKWMSPLKMFEYMSHKTVIVSSNHRVLKEVLNSKNSFMINNYHEDLWANKIKYILKNKKLAKKKADIAYQDAIQYTWKNRVKLIMKFN